jgi:peptide/nickel transport system substrate-binding protein
VGPVAQGVYANKNYDLTLISHAEPFDLGNFSRPGYYSNYESPKFAGLYMRKAACQPDRLSGAVFKRHSTHT